MKVKDLIKVLSELDPDKEITTGRSLSKYEGVYKVYPINEYVTISTPDSLGNYNITTNTSSSESIVDCDITTEHNVIGYLIRTEDTITDLHEVIYKANIKYDK